jgi:hypothetical protein
MGLDLYQPQIQMMRWGDRWLGLPVPLILTHLGCGQDFHPEVVCSHCREPLDAREVSYRLSYLPPDAGPQPDALLEIALSSGAQTR